MQSVDLNKVSSCSSEDPAYPADNLLKVNGLHKWKCAKPGEAKAIVCFQLKSPLRFGQIDVGNEGSALVEVLVSRSADPTDTWQVLLAAASLMSPADAKKGSDLNRVRTFRADQLQKPASGEKWDRVRVVCSQPFNKAMQYGLSFFKLSALGDGGDSGSLHTKVGDFSIRDEDEDANGGGDRGDRDKKDKDPAEKDKDPIKPGALFTSQQQQKQKKPDDTTDQSDAKKADEEKAKAARPKLFKAAAALSSSEDEDSEKKKKQQPQQQQRQKSNKDDDDDSGDGDESDGDKFGKILTGVVFAMSGYQNPRRAQLRDKAVRMGAKYRPDWGPGCTHLICAFANTPKFNQVLGIPGSRIVIAEWIDQCHKERRLVDWRLFDLAAKSSSAAGRGGGGGGGRGRPTRAVAAKKPNYAADVGSSDDDEDNGESGSEAEARKQKKRKSANSSKPGAGASTAKRPRRGDDDVSEGDGDGDSDSDDSAKRKRLRKKKSGSSDDDWRGGDGDGDDDEEEEGEDEEDEDGDDSDGSDSDSDYKTGGRSASSKKKLQKGKKGSKKKKSSSSKKGSPSKKSSPKKTKKPSLTRQPSSRPVRAAAVAAAAKAKQVSDSDEEDDYEDDEKLTTKPKPVTKSPPPKRRSQPASSKAAAVESGDEDDEDAGAGWSVVRRKKAGGGDSSGGGSPQKKRRRVSSSSEGDGNDKDEYKADTDVDDKGGDDNKDLPDFFDGARFFVYGKTIDEAERRQLKRVVYAFNGRLEEYNGPEVKYIITREAWDDNFDDALRDNSGVTFVRPDWLFELERTRKFSAPQDKYKVTSSSAS